MTTRQVLFVLGVVALGLAVVCCGGLVALAVLGKSLEAAS